jgi:hypothetical protein
VSPQAWQKTGRACAIVLAVAMVPLYIYSASRPPSYDAQHGYLPMAKSIRHFEPLHNRDGQPIATWPPAWPLVLAVLGNRHLASLAMLAGIGLVVLQARGAWMLCLVIASNTVLLHWAAVTTSEPAFVLFVVAACRAMEARRTVPTALAVGMAALTRYVGVCLLPLGAVFLWKKGWRQALLYAVIAVLPLACWVARNVAIFGLSGCFGPRAPSEVNLVEAVLAMPDRLAVVCLGPLSRYSILHVPALVVLGGLMVIAWRAWRGPWLWCALLLLAAAAYGESAARVYPSARYAVPALIPLTFYVWDGIRLRLRPTGHAGGGAAPVTPGSRVDRPLGPATMRASGAGQGNRPDGNPVQEG